MPFVTQQWTIGLDNKGTPGLYELLLQHDLEKRIYFLNGKFVENFSIPPNKAGTTRDIFVYNCSKIRTDIERVKGKFIYKLRINDKKLCDHNRMFNAQNVIWSWKEGEMKNFIILNKPTGDLYTNGDKVAAFGDENYKSFLHDGARFQLIVTKSEAGNEFNLLRQSTKMDQVVLQGTGDKICDAEF